MKVQQLTGKKVAILVTDGFEQDELLSPLEALREAGFKRDWAKCHINGIESFWSFAKPRLAKHRGIRAGKFPIHLKESEWRWNHRRDNPYALLLYALFPFGPQQLTIFTRRGMQATLPSRHAKILNDKYN